MIHSAYGNSYKRTCTICDIQYIWYLWLHNNINQSVKYMEIFTAVWSRLITPTKYFDNNKKKNGIDYNISISFFYKRQKKVPIS